MRLNIGEARHLDVHFDFATDGRGNLLRETAVVHGTQYKKDAPRVFLLDLTKNEMTCRPVMATPSGNALEGESNVDFIARTIGELKKNFPEVRNFLDDDGNAE